MLKNKFTLFLLFIFLNPGARLHSQTKKWELGIVAGSGIVSVRTTTIDYPKTFRGFSEGLALNYQAGKKFALATNVFYEQKRYKTALPYYDLQRNIDHANMRDTYQHIDLSLMASWRFGSKTKFLLNVGEYVTYLIKEIVDIQATYFGGPANQAIILDVTSSRKFGAGAILGLGVIQPLSETMSLSLEFRNYIGLNDISAKTSPTAIYMNYQALLFGINFKIGKVK